MNELSKRIRRYREIKDWSQKEMARLGGVTQASYSRYENQDIPPSSTFIKNLAQHSDINLVWLFTGVGGTTVEGIEGYEDIKELKAEIHQQKEENRQLKEKNTELMRQLIECLQENNKLKSDFLEKIFKNFSP